MLDCFITNSLPFISVKPDLLEFEPKYKNYKTWNLETVATDRTSSFHSESDLLKSLSSNTTSWLTIKWILISFGIVLFSMKQAQNIRIHDVNFKTNQVQGWVKQVYIDYNPRIKKITF